MRFFPSKQLFRILAILLALALTASACGSDGADETSAVETADTSEMQDTEEPADTGDDFSGFSVVMILDGSAQDGGWNSTHVRGGASTQHAAQVVERVRARRQAEEITRPAAAIREAPPNPRDRGDRGGTVD